MDNVMTVLQAPKPGILVISLDFELNWGVRDKPEMDYAENILGARRAIPFILNLFERYEIHATWATVGFLFCENRDELLTSLPSTLPRYTQSALSPYSELSGIGESESSDPMHFGLSLIRLITQTPNQEIGSHTFSHYYCLEDGQVGETFEADIEAAVNIASRRGIRLKSIVFPRNQVNENYLHILPKYGFTSYRGTEGTYINQPHEDHEQSLLKRGIRLVDSYLPLSGHNCHTVKPGEYRLINIPASRFLRPINPRLLCLEDLRLLRVMKDMSFAARHGLVYHLWWHPHNFGRHMVDNLVILEHILQYYRKLCEYHNMRSLSMGEFASETLESI